MDNLKPCPFCGSKMSVTYNSLGVFNFWHSDDKECPFNEPFQISVKKAKTLSEATDLWNRRI